MSSVEDRLREMLEEAKGQIIEMDELISRLLSAPQVYATVVHAKNEFNLSALERGDMMLILDKTVRKKCKSTYGRIVSDGVKNDGTVDLAIPSGMVVNLCIGLNGSTIQAKLLGKDDGTNCVIVVGGKLF